MRAKKFFLHAFFFIFQTVNKKNKIENDFLFLFGFFFNS